MTFQGDHFTQLMLKYACEPMKKYESEVQEGIAQFISDHLQHVISEQDRAFIFEMCFFMTHWNNSDSFFMMRWNNSDKKWNIEVIGINAACSLAHASLQLTSLPIVQEYLAKIRHIVFNEVYRHHHKSVVAMSTHSTYVMHMDPMHKTTYGELLDFAETTLNERQIE
jgi:hypothetical protein